MRNSISNSYLLETEEYFVLLSFIFSKNFPAVFFLYKTGVHVIKINTTVAQQQQ